jgi:hypothetical protein
VLDLKKKELLNYLSDQDAIVVGLVEGVKELHVDGKGRLKRGLKDYLTTFSQNFRGDDGLQERRRGGRQNATAHADVKLVHGVVQFRHFYLGGGGGQTF